MRWGSHFCVQRWSEQQLRQDLGFTRERARQLAQWGWGQCSAPVTKREPPKTLSVQMSLTPVPLAMHPSFEGRSVCDDDSSTGLCLCQLPGWTSSMLCQGVNAGLMLSEGMMYSARHAIVVEALKCFDQCH